MPNMTLTLRVPHFAFATVCSAASCASIAVAQHGGDIGLAVSDGAIVTHELSGVDPELGPLSRLFLGELGEAGSPHFANEPGFDSLPGTFQVGSRVGIQFTAQLLVWDGAGFVPTSDAGPLAGERMRASFATLSTTTGEGPVAGFDLAVQPNGAWHRHLSWTLLPAVGAAEPDAGVYLVQFQMYSTDPSVAASLPLAILFNDGASEEDHESAYAAALPLFNAAHCPADLNGSGTVDGADLGALLAAWGLGGAADLTGDGVVNGADLGSLLADWGACGR